MNVVNCHKPSHSPWLSVMTIPLRRGSNFNVYLRRTMIKLRHSLNDCRSSSPLAVYVCLGRCYIYIHIHTYITLNLHLHSHLHSHSHLHFIALHYTYIHTYLHTYIHTSLHTYIPTYIHTYIHACMHTCIHRYIDT